MFSENRERRRWTARFVTSLGTLFLIALLCSPGRTYADTKRRIPNWVGTWATAPQPSGPTVQSFHDQTLRLIVHTSIGGSIVRIKISNTYGDRPMSIGAAHIGLRTSGAEIEPSSDRSLTFGKRHSADIKPGTTIESDPVGLDVPALADLAISIFLPDPTAVTTVHSLSKQTSYISESGDHSADRKFPVAKSIRNWPFLTGVEVMTSSRGTGIVAFGSSLTDGDGTTSDSNRRWPDVLAERLQKAGQTELGVLNEGIIGNRLLKDSPVEAVEGRFGRILGESGLARFERDVLAQPRVKYVIVGLGINDIAFPGSLTTDDEVTVEMIIAGYRQLISHAHRKGVKIIGTTNPPFENSFLALPPPAETILFYTPKKEIVRQKVNEWILRSGEFDGVVDLDKVLRDPNRPTRLNPAYDSGDHLHPNDSGAIVEAGAFPLNLFGIQFSGIPG